MRFHRLLLATAALLSACESDDKKLQRFDNNRLMTCLLAQRDSSVEDSVRSSLDGSAVWNAWNREVDSLTQE